MASQYGFGHCHFSSTPVIYQLVRFNSRRKPVIIATIIIYHSNYHSSLFHSRLKTYLFNKFFIPQLYFFTNCLPS